MTDTPTAAAAPAVAMSADEILVHMDAVILGILNENRVDMAALRQLPRWRAVQVARLAYLAGAITRGERDTIVREAAVYGAVKPAKTEKPR